MTHPFETSHEIKVDATPDEVWEAIASGPGVDSWLMGTTGIDGANKTVTFAMFGEVSRHHLGLGTRSPLRTDDAMYLLIHGYNDMVFATAHFFDDRDPSAETEAWQSWLAGLAA